MTYQAIPGLAYNGKQVYVDDGVATPTGPVVTPPPPSTPSLETTIPYRVVARNGGENEDNYYIYKKLVYQYRQDMKPVNAQIYPDIVAGATNLQLSTLINTASYSPNLGAFNPDTYSGPLVQIYKNLVAKKKSI